jgi:uncharacterized integral membrane protein
MFIDASKGISYRRAGEIPHRMNAKLIFKTLFLILVLMLLVLMGMNNGGKVSFSLPPLIPRTVSSPAAMMYFAFFAIGVLTGTVLTAGGKKGGSASSSKSSK